MPREFARLLSEDLNVGIGPATKPNPGGGILTGTKIGVHTFAVGNQKCTAVWDPPPVLPAQSVTTTLVCPGAAMGDFVNASFSLSLQGLSMDASIDAPNTVKVVLANNTPVTIDLGSGILAAVVFKCQ